MPARFSTAQIEQISRTVRHTPEVMVKVTGGGTRKGAVAAHFAYFSRQGTLEIETDEGERIGRREEHKRLLDDWHLELTAGQYRRQMDGCPARRADEARSQHRAFHAKADAPGQGSHRRAAIRPPEIRATPLRHGLAHPPAAPARASGRQGRERLRPAAAHRQAALAGLARGLRAVDARTGHCGQRHAACHSRQKQEKAWGRDLQSTVLRQVQVRRDP